MAGWLMVSRSSSRVFGGDRKVMCWVVGLASMVIERSKRDQIKKVTAVCLIMFWNCVIGI